MSLDPWESGMKRILIALALLAGCGATDQENNRVAAQGDPKGTSTSRESVEAGGSGLTGLYESGPAAQTSQLCMIEGRGDKAQFGLVVWGANMHSCAGAGEAVRNGTSLRLAMAGDQACALDARMEGSVIILPKTVPEGCSYYCGARAQLAGASFTKKGGRVEDAMKATDLVGEPLCEAPSTEP